MSRLLSILVLLISAGPLAVAAAESSPQPRMVGVAKVDITPAYPVRLSGYGNRREEFEAVEQQIWAKALAIGSDEEGAAVIVTVDNCGVPAWMRNDVAARLQAKAKLSPDRFALCFSHTHCAPCLKGALVNIFSTDVPPEHQERIDRYSAELTGKLEAVVLAALADRKPAQLSWAVGSVSFARNRRAQGGPVDFDLPALFVHAPDGRLRAVFTSYACHATTLQFNRVHGDWPGTAMEAIERDHPGAIVLVALGCGADQNPHPRGTVELATQHGGSVADEVKRLLGGKRTPVHGKLECRTKEIALAYDTLPTHEQWKQLANEPRHQVVYHAKKNLARLERGEKLPTELPYLVAAWNFGSDLAMVFLPGEVTVDYGLRIKTDFDRSRVWVNGYANDAPCYIPSQRVLKEGGYEGGFSMIYYDRPTKFASDVEERIMTSVHELVPKEFKAKQVSDTPPPLSPAQSLASIQTKPGFTVELAVAEPMVVDPIAIDWGADGKLWVVEMNDYPMGIDANWKPGGRVKYLEDTDKDGRYDRSTLFLADLPFPTGIMPWRKGVLICAAPDILYAEDTDDDGRADVVKKLFSGFETNNYQARVNSLALGLDNWVHGANGLLGGVIRGMSNTDEVDIRGRDIRFNPDTLVFETAPGVTQQGRCRDDWGNWFGCSNGVFIFQFPLADHYVRRNPHVPAPASRVLITADAEPSRVFPISESLDRFNNPNSLNTVTSGCGLGIYRDTLLGEQFRGDAFTCEPVHNLVHRSKLIGKGVAYEGRRAEDEKESEFLASTDNWFRPVQVRTGPDGALWVVDMYRAVIEHPRWIPGDKLAKLDVRAGADRGRIYRIYPTGTKLRPVENLTALATSELAAALDTPNGTTRDLVHAELLQRADQAAIAPLTAIVRSGRPAAIRLQALCILDGLEAASAAILHEALADVEPAVRRHAVRISEPMIASQPTLLAACAALQEDPDTGVRYQLALALGHSTDPLATKALATIANSAPEDPWIRAAVISSSAARAGEILSALLEGSASGPGRNELIASLFATAAATATGMDDLGRLLASATRGSGEGIEPWQISGLLKLQDAFDRRKIDVTTLEEVGDRAMREAAAKSRQLFAAVHGLAADEKAELSLRVAAVRLFGRGYNSPEKDIPLLAPFLRGGVHADMQKAALDTLAKTRSPKVPELVLAEWARYGPSTRSAIIGLLLSRPEWSEALIASVEKMSVSASDLPADARQRLIESKNESLRQRAIALFPKRENQRAAILAKYSDVPTLKGDPVKGATVYQNMCSLCHVYLGQGHEVGPSIMTFRSKPVEDFVLAIVDPNAVVEPRYAAYLVELKDGRQLSGVIQSETATTLVLAQAGGIRENILRSEIVSMKTTNVSLMPEGLDQALTPQEMADVIAYLKGNG